MKKLIAVFILSILCAGISFSYEEEIKKDSSFRVQGRIEMREAPDFDSEPQITTLNHEGGLKVVVIEEGEADEFEGEHGRWFYIFLKAPLWTETGYLLPKYSKYWIFLPDDATLFEFENFLD